MKIKNKNKTVLSAIIMLFVCALAGGTVFAYDPPGKILNTDDNDMTLEFTVTEMDVIEIGTEKLPYDFFYTDEYGTIHEMLDTELIPRSSCKHNYSIAVKLSKHEVNTRTGGCTITYWNASKCSKCGAVKKGTMINTVSYGKCPH